MREFFKGWRRKAGCVALVIACVLMVAWMRSHFFTEGARFISGDQQHLVCGADGCVCWCRWPLRRGREWGLNGWISIPSSEAERHMLQHLLDRVGAGVVKISYWSLTLPLTLLSAYLLLWKPRPKSKGEPNA